MRILVCGGRYFDDETSVFNWLLRFEEERGPIRSLVHGGARGADSIAAAWARAENIPSIAVKANWKKHGKAAGPIRNQKMIDDLRPEVVIAFPGGRGTEDMVRRSKAAGLEVIEVDL